MGEWAGVRSTVRDEAEGSGAQTWGLRQLR